MRQQMVLVSAGALAALSLFLGLRTVTQRRRVRKTLEKRRTTRLAAEGAAAAAAAAEGKP